MDAILKYILKFLVEFLFGKEPKKKTNSRYRNVPSAPKTVHLSALMKASEIPFMSINISQINSEPDIWAERKNTLSEFN